MSDTSRSAWALSMVGVEEEREFRFRGDLYSQESTFPLVYALLLLLLGLRDATYTCLHSR